MKHAILFISALLLLIPQVNAQIGASSDSVWLDILGVEGSNAFTDSTLTVQVRGDFVEWTWGAALGFGWTDTANWTLDSVIYGPAMIHWEIKGGVDTSVINSSGTYLIGGQAVFSHNYTAPGDDLLLATIHFSLKQGNSWETGSTNVIDSTHAIAGGRFVIRHEDGERVPAAFGGWVAVSNLDSDGDTILDPFDNCPTMYNIFQIDQDSNGVGDLCQFSCGDIDADTHVGASDIVRLVDYYFNHDESVATRELGDINCDGRLDLQDIMNLISYVNGQLSELCCSLENPKDPDVIYMYQRDQK